MEKEGVRVAELSTAAVFILLSVLLGWWIGKQVPVKPPDDGGPGGGVASTGAHQVAVSNNSTCVPSQHLGTVTAITKMNPMFCWDPRGYDITDWKFDLKTYPSGQVVTGCTTSGYVSTSTKSIVCSVNLAAGTYYGDLWFHMGGQLIQEQPYHYFSPS